MKLESEAVEEPQEAVAVEEPQEAVVVEEAQEAVAVEEAQEAVAVEEAQEAVAVEEAQDAVAVEEPQEAVAVEISEADSVMKITDAEIHCSFCKTPGHKKCHQDHQLQEDPKSETEAKEQASRQEQLKQNTLSIEDLKCAVKDLTARVQRSEIEEDKLRDTFLQDRNNYELEKSDFQSDMIDLKNQLEGEKTKINTYEKHILDLTAAAVRNKLNLKVFKADGFAKDLSRIIIQSNGNCSMAVRNSYTEFCHYIFNCLALQVSFEMTYVRLRDCLKRGDKIDMAEMIVGLPKFPQPCSEISQSYGIEPQVNSAPTSSESNAPPPYSELHAPPPYRGDGLGPNNGSRENEVSTSEDNQAPSASGYPAPLWAFSHFSENTASPLDAAFIVSPDNETLISNFHETPTSQDSENSPGSESPGVETPASSEL